MLMARIKYHILPKLSPKQYGFMPQKSTEDSLYDLMKHITAKLNEKKLITIVSLDIEGAFDSAWWPAIRLRLAENVGKKNISRVINSYLDERKVMVRYSGEQYTKITNKGCVQGSIGGPVLWNILLDPLLKDMDIMGHYVQAFADDIVLVFDEETGQGIERRANAGLEHVRGWGIENKLQFAPHNTSAMVITRKLKFDAPQLSMGGISIGMSKEIKILGATVDHRLTYNTHVANVCRKAINIHKQLARAAKVSWGLHPEIIRTIYTATVEPIILYAASVWVTAADKIGIRKQLGAVQRGFAQKMCRPYRTVSLNSALVLAGVLPLDLRIREMASLYEVRRGVPRPELRGREIEQMAPATRAPHPADHITLKFMSLVDQESVNANSDYAVKIYTDGSKIDGKVGAALSIWSGAVETRPVKLCLPSYCTVYQAELLAICEATRYITKNNASTYGIYSDSTASLQTITNLASLHPLAVKTRKNLKTASQQNKVVAMYWIKAHAGLEGNERADYLAKEAALNTKKKPDYDLCPVSFAKRILRMESLCEWNKRYGSGETAGTTKIFFPDAVAAYRTIRKFEPTNITTQIFTGHASVTRKQTTNPKEMIPTTKPALIISPTKEVHSPAEILQKWKKYISFRDTNFSPASVKYVSNNKLRVEFDTEVQRDESEQQCSRHQS
ncbi:uncharacterized protein LOC113236103 [Hyposmocoma kahamanoa]|uniref:uncharacterized protein LOC113236103 n=1 Tax=Hyposmocoma kahamanoa TaxID=1477025 RepID=UPI000E6D8EFD|nr:uncharacterized protein LOC113236103 [Hyposmocoma kahamanoa]